MAENPYAAPTDPPVKPSAGNTPRRLLSRRELAARLAFVGWVGGAALGTVGYVALTLLFDAALTPPLKSPPNYGQFAFVVVTFGFYMSLFGLALAVLPYLGWAGYAVVHLAGLAMIWLGEQAFFLEVDWIEAPMAAMILLFMSPTFVAIGLSYRYREIKVTK